MYRSPGGAGVRLDGGVVFGGSEVGAHFDSMLVSSPAGDATWWPRPGGPTGR
ncbi:MAG: hypothetical protein R2719_05805 [Micropruina sp.]